MTLTYRFEYPKALGKDKVPQVLLVQEWLVNHKDYLQGLKLNLQHSEFKLLAHCTEKTTAAPSIRDWQDVFAALGQSLQPIKVGCCGMAGTYGHETLNAETSRRIYGLSWSEVVNDPAHWNQLVVTGYSCRSQVKRIEGRALKHPLQALLSLMPSS